MFQIDSPVHVRSLAPFSLGGGLAKKEQYREFEFLLAKRANRIRSRFALAKSRVH